MRKDVVRVRIHAHRVLLGAGVLVVWSASSGHVFSVSPSSMMPRVQASRTIAVTFDDVPGTPAAGNCDRAAIVDMNRRLITAIQQAEIPALGLVIEGLGCDALRPHVLREVFALWLEAGLSLGNHTFSHPDFNTTSVADYEAEILNGEEILRPMLAARGDAPTYFRYPQLHAGDTPEKKAAIEAFLEQRGYVNAPVTIDSQEWVFAGAYRRALRRGNAEVARCVAAAYVPFMEDVVAFFENWSVEVMGYEIPQVLLLHVNELNADYLPELVAMLRQRGYGFVSLDEALTDPAYAQLEEYVGPRGLSWLHRWALTRGMELQEEPRDPSWVADLNRQRDRADMADWTCLNGR